VGNVNGRDLQFVAQMLEFRTHGDSQLRIQIRQGFIHQEHLRSAHDRPGKRDALPLSAGQLTGLAFKEVRQLDSGCHAFHQRRDLRPFNPPHFQRVSDVVENRHVRIESVVLEDHGHVPVFRKVFIDHAVTDPDFAVRWLFKPGDHPHCRGFPASGRT